MDMSERGGSDWYIVLLPYNPLAVFFFIFQDSKTKLEFFSIEKIKEKYIVDMGINIWSEGFDKLSVPINIRQ